MDYEKLAILYSDKRVQPRSKLVFALLESGMTLQEIIDYPAENIGELKLIKNGESFFMQYIKGVGVLERIAKNGRLFPGTDDKPMQEVSILRALRRACRSNGFQLHQLQIEGLVGDPIISQDGIQKPSNDMSFDDVLSFIKNQKQ